MPTPLSFPKFAAAPNFGRPTRLPRFLNGEPSRLVLNKKKRAVSRNLAPSLSNHYACHSPTTKRAHSTGGRMHPASTCAMGGPGRAFPNSGTGDTRAVEPSPGHLRDLANTAPNNSRVQPASELLPPHGRPPNHRRCSHCYRLSPIRFFPHRTPARPMFITVYTD